MPGESERRPARKPRRGLWINPIRPAQHLSNPEEKRRQIYRAIDYAGFDWQVFFVSASGFFTDSYNLFATNVILPSIAYVYWPDAADDVKHQNETIINCMTLAGSAIGQLLFGYLADRYGRRKLYGLELIIVIVSTLGLTQASDGYKVGKTASMSILGWLSFYRLLQGVGIGAEYPLSGVITAEFAPVASRARMMAAVFLMQPLGQTLAALVGLFVAIGYDNTKNLHDSDDSQNEAMVTIDQIWRWVIGVGAIPALIAILFRLTIPESPRYTLDVEGDADRALHDAKAFYPMPAEDDSAENGQAVIRDEADDNDSLAIRSIRSFRLDDPASPSQSPSASIREKDIITQTAGSHFWSGLRTYLFGRGNWRRLAGTSLCWAILDFAYYGLGINSPRTIAQIWASEPQPSNATFTTSWDSGLVTGDTPLASDGDNIFYVLRNDSIRSLITSCLGSLLGSLVLIKIIPYISRRAMLYWSFIILFVLMVVIGTTLFAVFETNLHAITMALYVLTQLVFNLGPNTLLFIIPAEIFPTKYRATCYGISSAAGKLSSVAVQAFLPYVKSGFNDKKGLAIVLIVFGVLMLPGAWVAWLWIPEVQDGRAKGNGLELPSRTLEELADEDDRPQRQEDNRPQRQQDAGQTRNRRAWMFGREKSPMTADLDPE